MAVYCVTGNLGSGKSLVTVGRLVEYLRQGRRVATNLDLRMEHVTELKRPNRPLEVIRLPDVPSTDDFIALGTGQQFPPGWAPGQVVDESRNGAIFLDEISSILDSRQWQGKERIRLIDWLKHARKLGWDLYLIVQHESMLDAQVRKFLLEHVVVCKRMDRVPIPFLGFFLKSFGFSGKFMRAHLATVRYGNGAHSLVAERWWFRGVKLFQCYNTRQVFRPQRSAHLNDEKGQPLRGDDGQPLPDDNPQGIFQYLDGHRAPWLLPERSWRDQVARWLLERRSPWARELAEMLGVLREPGAWFDFWMCETYGPPRYQPAAVSSFASWLHARRDTAPEGGPRSSTSSEGGEGNRAAAHCPDFEPHACDLGMPHAAFQALSQAA